MLNLNLLFEFSRNHCITICAFIIPANLLLTLQTILLVGLNRSQIQIQKSMVIASFLALTMLVHVLSWFMIGIVMIPTYILLTLGGICLILNIWAVIHPVSMRQTYILRLITLWANSLRHPESPIPKP